MTGAPTAIRRNVLYVHRWMGAVFAPVFLSWFLSGMVLMYCPFPQVTDDDRLGRSATLDSSQLRCSPGEALQAVPNTSSPERVRILMLDGRPAYRFDFGETSRLVYGDDGEPLTGISPAMALRMARIGLECARTPSYPAGSST